MYKRKEWGNHSVTIRLSLNDFGLGFRVLFGQYGHHHYGALAYISLLFLHIEPHLIMAPIWERKAKSIAQEIDWVALFEQMRHGGLLKVWRIKIFRRMAIANGWPFGLKESKEWVERHFPNKGVGIWKPD